MFYSMAPTRMFRVQGNRDTTSDHVSIYKFKDPLERIQYMCQNVACKLSANFKLSLELVQDRLGSIFDYQLYK